MVDGFLVNDGEALTRLEWSKCDGPESRKSLPVCPDDLRPILRRENLSICIIICPFVYTEILTEGRVSGALTLNARYEL